MQKAKSTIPPKLAQKILHRFLRDDLAEEVLGDLDEKFYSLTENKSAFRAKVNYWYQVINYLRPFAIRKSRPAYLNQYDMIQSYFKVSWRNMLKQKMYSFIKIGGLALGIAACFLISLFIREELSYDKHYADHDRIYRFVGVFNDDGDVSKDVWFQAPFASAVKQEYPEVEMTARYNAGVLFGAGNAQIRRADRIENTYEEGLAYVDQSLLDILQLPMVYGSREHALSEPNTIVITKRKADKFFPGEDPVGKLLIVNNDVDHAYKIGGVVKDFPATSHIQFDFMITMTGREFWKGEQNWWGATNYPTYVKVRAGTDPKALADKITKGIVEKYILPLMIAETKMSDKEARAILEKGHLELQPLTSIYMGADVNDRLPHSDMRFIWLFGTIAAFIVIIACINFVNLSTAKSANRAKEVGLRKVVGSQRNSLIGQFLTESIVFSLLSFILGLVLAWLLLPFFNQLSAKSLIFPWTEWKLIPIVAGAVIIVGLLAGLYPSFYLSSFRPIQVLKGNLSLGSKNSYTRSALVIFQFTTSIILIVGTFVIYQQMDFILNKDLGFNKDQVMLIQGAGTLNEKIKTFKEELLQQSQVKNVSVSDYLPVSDTKRNGNTFFIEGKVDGERGVSGQFWRVDDDYVGTMGMKILEGRNFDPQKATDAKSAIINQVMVKQLNLTDPIGKRITNYGDVWEVIGVVENFHFESLKKNIEPLCLVLGHSPDIVSVKIASADLHGTIEEITKIWKRFAPHQPIRYTFLDERYSVMYDDVKRMGRIFISFAVFALSVACLGLFALSAFMVEQRSKEISIRLILGASMKSIFNLLTNNFVKLVFISFVIATPVAWYVMQKWLEDYVYRIDISWDMFIIAGLMALVIAMLTVSYQSIKAALVKPVNNLRSE